VGPPSAGDAKPPADNACGTISFRVWATSCATATRQQVVLTAAPERRAPRAGASEKQPRPRGRDTPVSPEHCRRWLPPTKSPALTMEGRAVPTSPSGNGAGTTARWRTDEWCRAGGLPKPSMGQSTVQPPLCSPAPSSPEAGADRALTRRVRHPEPGICQMDGLVPPVLARGNHLSKGRLRGSVSSVPQMPAGQRQDTVAVDRDPWRARSWRPEPGGPRPWPLRR
jgi:hypothetical protein